MMLKVFGECFFLYTLDRMVTLNADGSVVRLAFVIWME